MKTMYEVYKDSFQRKTDKEWLFDDEVYAMVNDQMTRYPELIARCADLDDLSPVAHDLLAEYVDVR